jgi:hypothetical protein
MKFCYFTPYGFYGTNQSSTSICHNFPSHILFILNSAYAFPNRLPHIPSLNLLKNGTEQHFRIVTSSLQKKSMTNKIKNLNLHVSIKQFICIKLALPIIIVNVALWGQFSVSQQNQLTFPLVLVYNISLLSHHN